MLHWFLQAFPESPHRLARPRTPPFHGDNRGSNPLGDANLSYPSFKCGQPMHQSDVGYITALANDVGAEVIFLRQLIAPARPEDIAAGISTSGGSKISSWRSKRRKRSMLTVAFLGYDGGEILRRGLADRPLIVRS